MNQKSPIFAFADETAVSYGYGDKGSAFVDRFDDAKAKSVFSLDCPYCELRCESENDNTSWDVTGWVSDSFACCSRCGWWSYQSDSDNTDGEPTYNSVAAILKRFDRESPDVPADVLVSYISRDPDLIHDIHPAKLEELVGSIYSEVLGYRVERCSYGRPDRGIDLVVVNAEGDHTLAIQVKRNRRPIELGMIHQFFGAMVDDGHKEGVFVTSGSFRRGAQKVADSLESKVQIRIDLIEGKRLLEFLGIMNRAHRWPHASDFPFWRSHPYFGKQ